MNHSLLVLGVVLLGVVLLGVVPVYGEYTVSIGKNGTVIGCNIDDSCYAPSVLVITYPSIVVWVNDDSIIHTITSGKITDDYVGGFFDSGILYPGDSYYHIFGKSGTYEYFSVLQPWMNGTIIVTSPEPVQIIEPDPEPMPNPKLDMVPAPTDLQNTYGTIPVEYNGIKYNIVYAGNVKISEIIPSSDSIMINLGDVSGSFVLINMPKSMLDSFGRYDIFADGQKTDFKIVGSVLDSYILDISIDDTTQKIEIKSETASLNVGLIEDTPQHVEPVSSEPKTDAQLSDLQNTYGTIPVEYNGIKYNIVYAGNVKISEIIPSSDSIMINLGDVSGSFVLINMPKSMLDSFGRYDIFADGQKTDFKIVGSVLDSYILDISIDDTTQKIEITKQEGIIQNLNILDKILNIIKNWLGI